MAYHYQGKAWPEEIDKPQDALDACAYSILVALFSLVEEGLEEKWTQRFLITANNLVTNKLVGAWHDDADAGDAAPAKILARLAKQLPRGFGEVRLSVNAKLGHRYRQVVTAAKAEDVHGLKQAVARFCASAKMANEPGEECIAVVMDRNRDLYVAGNGLWAFGGSFPAGDIEVVPPDWDVKDDREGHHKRVGALQRAAEPTMPWFNSRDATRLALELVSPDVIGEYGARRVVYICPTSGDFNGHFHAEMQLLDLMVSSGIYPVRRYVGVSKPCCGFCAAALREVGLRFWTEHGARGEDPRKDDKVAPKHVHFRDAKLLEAFREALTQH